MNLTDETYDRLISKIFSAALDSSQWQGFLDTLGAASGGVRTQMHGHDLRHNHAQITAYSNYDPAFEVTWAERYGALNVWAPGMMELPVGIATAAEAIVGDESVQKTEFYQDWLRPQEDIRSGGCLILDKSQFSFFALGSNMRAKDSDTLQTPFLSLLQRLTPHLQSALAISRRIGAMQIENAALARTGAGADAAVVVLDGAQRLVYANAQAQAQLAGGVVLRSTMRGRVDFTEPDANRRLALAIDGLNRPGAHMSSAFTLGSGGRGPDLQCRMARLDLPELVLHRVLVMSGQLGGPCLLITLAPAFSPASAVGLLIEHHALTRAEAEIAAGIAAGGSLRDLAEARGTSHHTVRNQLKSVLSKTHQHSQRDLTRLVLQLAG